MQPAVPITLRAWLVLGALILGCNGLGAASALGASAAGTRAIFQALIRPSWAPPPWLFGPAWTALYTMMAIATWIIWRRTDGAARRTALALFALQLALNLAWTPIFFGLHAIAASVVVILGNLLAVIATTIAYYRRVPIAGVLLMPLIGWVSFASALNIAIWSLNR
jgi:translocator protein